jgi:iron complex outermembrane recepter protein
MLTQLVFLRRGGVGTVFSIVLAFFLLSASGLAEESETPKDAAAPTKTPPHDPEGILNLDIDQLGKVDVRAPQMNVEVTSVSKQESTVGRSPAAIYVMTQEMIHRSGANNVPDLLRLVPGMEVARINSHTWAVSSRGLTDRYPYNITEIERSVFGKVTWRF